MPFISPQKAKNAGDVFQPWFRQQHNASSEMSRRFQEVYEPLMKMLKRRDGGDDSEATIAVGKITAITAGHPQPKYDAISVIGPSFEVENTTPQRDSGDSNMFPAPVGSPCFLFTLGDDPTVYLEVFGEVLEFGSCPEPPGSAAKSSSQIQPQLNASGYSQQQFIEFLFGRINTRTGTRKQASGSSTSGTPGTAVASITAASGYKLINWHLSATQVSAANTQFTVTITYADTSTITHTTTAARQEQVKANAGGILNETSIVLVAGSDLEVTAIAVTTAGTGTSTRAAIISATEAKI